MPRTTARFLVKNAHILRPAGFRTSIRVNLTPFAAASARARPTSRARPGPKQNFPGAIGALARLRREAALAEQRVKRHRLTRRDQQQRLARLELVHRVEDRNQRRPARREKRSHIKLQGWQRSHRKSMPATEANCLDSDQQSQRNYRRCPRASRTGSGPRQSYGVRAFAVRQNESAVCANLVFWPVGSVLPLHPISRGTANFPPP